MSRTYQSSRYRKSQILSNFEKFFFGRFQKNSRMSQIIISNFFIIFSVKKPRKIKNEAKSPDSESSVESTSRMGRPTAFQSSQLRVRQSELENERRNTKQTLRTSQVK